VGVVGVVGGVGDGGVGPAMQMLGLNPPLSGVHLSTPSEYIPLQHPFMHWEFEEHCSQSPSDPVVGEVGVVGVVGVPESSLDTQKKAPPLHANSLLLYVLRSAIIFTAVAAFTLEPVPPQSPMQWPKIIYEKQRDHS